MRPEIKEILEALKNCYFSELSEATYYDDIICQFKEKYHKPFGYDAGASKVVLTFENLGFVIKIPFEGYYPDAEYDEETDEYYDSEFEYFCNADADSEWDYCEAEANRYNEAKTYGVEDCFAKCEKIATINSHPIYLQEYATMYDWGKSSNHTDKDKETVSKICSDNRFDCFNTEWLSDVFNYFGEKIFYTFMEFLKDYNINDLHNGNIGYINARPVLVDYAGWGD